MSDSAPVATSMVGSAAMPMTAPVSRTQAMAGRLAGAILRVALAGLFMLLVGLPGIASAERLKDLASIAGVRDNPLLGYGIVVGLDGTGDQTNQVTMAEQSLRSMLTQYGVTVPPNVKLQPKNVAAVSIHAVMPAFAKPGQQIDITVSSLGNAKSLRGGSLLMAPLRGADGEVYAIAQGNLAVGGLGVSGADGSSLAINVPSVGRIPLGASIERTVANPFANGEHVIFNLHDPDFTTAQRVVDAINDQLGSDEAEALDSVSIIVAAPIDQSARVGFVGFLEEIDIEPGEGAGKVIVNSRTGTIVIGNHVTVGPAAVTHGSLTVTISENPQVSQPAPFGEGETVVVPDTTIAVDQGDNHMFEMPRGRTLNDIVQAINSVGAAPGDLVAILEALKQAGALRAQLIVI